MTTPNLNKFIFASSFTFTLQNKEGLCNILFLDLEASYTWCKFIELYTYDLYMQLCITHILYTNKIYIKKLGEVKMDHVF